MIKRVRARKSSDVGRFYDNIYAVGGYYSEENFNRRALSILGLGKDNKKKLLDVACGQGTLLKLAEDYIQTYGIDISKEAITKAKKNAKTTVFKVCSAERLPFPSRHFDYVACMGSLEHFINVYAALKEMKRVSKKGAKILIHIPNSNYLIHRILGIDTQGQINERLATEEEWNEILEKYFTIEKVYKYNTRWYLGWIPKKYCCHFTFLCLNK